MKNKASANKTSQGDDIDLDLIKDLERQSVDEIRKLRAHERVDSKIRLMIQHGDSSRLSEMRAQAYTSDISSGGCCAVSTTTITVGDIYRLSFDRKQLDAPLVFARCVRCRLLREDAFEAGFAFFSPISLSNSDETSKDDLLS